MHPSCDFRRFVGGLRHFDAATFATSAGMDLRFTTTVPPIRSAVSRASSLV